MPRKPSVREEVRQLCKDRRTYDGSKYNDKKAFYAQKKTLESQGKSIGNKYDYAPFSSFYSPKTYEKTVTEGVYFAQWLRDQNGGHRVPVTESADKVPEYIDHLKKEGYAIGTIRKKVSYLSKVYCRDYVQEVEIPTKNSESTSMGRGPESPHYRHDSDRNRPATAFYEAIGVRKNEYRNLPKNDYYARADKCEKLYGIRPEPVKGCLSNLVPVYDAAGQVEKVVTLHAKHGKINCMPILPEDRDLVTKAFETGKFVDYYSPSDHAQTHAARREKAQRLYDSVARDLATLPRSETYHTSAKYGSRVYDRAALAYVAEALGHGRQRLYDVVHCYMR